MKRKSICEALSASAIYVATCTLIFSTSPAQAQKTDASVTARTGIAIADEKYQSNCGDASLAFSLDVEGRGRVFSLVGRDTARWSAEDQARNVVANVDNAGRRAGTHKTITE